LSRRRLERVRYFRAEELVGFRFDLTGGRRVVALLAGAALVACRSSSAAEGAPSESAGPQPSAVVSASSRSATVGEAPDAAERAGAVAPRAHPDETVGPFNVVLILIDSLRADMPWAGYKRKIAPRLTALEKRSVSYTRAYSISSVTARSVAPLLVGKYPSEMPRNGFFFTQWYPENLFLSERVEAAGQRAMAVHAHAYFYGPSMRQGFSDYRVLPGTVYDDPEPKPTSQRLTREAERMLARRADATGQQRFFAYFHYMDPHQPYIEHEDEPQYGDEPRDAYDTEVHYTDRWVGELVAWIEKQSWGARTAVIVSADHGEAFGEHGQVRHGYELWESVVHVPLLFLVPGAPPRHIDTPRSHIDLAPTILELMGIPIDPPLRGKSLRAELFGAEAEPRPVVIDLPRDNLQDRRRAVVDARFKLVAQGDDERWFLFDLLADPRERKNLTEREPAELARMRKLYFELSEQIPNEEVHGKAVLKNAPPDRRW
jgi:arylsulfatase A-like enzyme